MGGTGEWTPKDRVLTLALTIYEAMICPECGNPYSVCRDPENAFETHQDICQARAAIDRHHAEQRKANTEPEPGAVLSARLEATESQFAPNPFKKR